MYLGRETPGACSAPSHHMHVQGLTTSSGPEMRLYYYSSYMAILDRPAQTPPVYIHDPGLKVFVKAGVVALAAFTSSAAAAAVVAPTEYKVSDVYQGQTFFDQFNFHDDVDPTHGFVDYKGQAAAKSQGLISVNALGQAYLGVDSKTVLTNLNQRGRASVRVESKKLYNGGLFIADIAHMPSSVCGVWPAFWTSGQQNWPNDGEIDIIENINEAQQNAVTLHTGTTDCTISKAAQGGSLVTSHCSNYFADHVTQWENQGCSVDSTDSKNNYGDSFNSVGGGIYALEWTGTTIKVWNFPRASADGIDALSAHPDPTKWRKATITTVGGSCDVKKLFKNHNLIIDTTFCGDYAGQDVFWKATTCYKSNPTKYASCASYVAANPSKYKDAYWLINGVKVYQVGPKSVVSSTSTKATSTKAPTSTKASTTAPTSTKASTTTASTKVPTSTKATSTEVPTSTKATSTSETSDVVPTPPVSTLSSTTDEVIPTTTDEVVPTTTDEVIPTTTDEVIPTTTDEVVPTTTDEVVPTTTDEVVPTTTDEVVPTTTDEVSTDEVVPTTTDEVVPTTTDEVVPTTTDEVVPTTTDEVVPTTTDEVVPTTTDEVVPTTTDVVPTPPVSTLPSTTDDVVPTPPVSTLSSKTYGNFSVTAPTSYPTLTSTVITTSVYTVTSCAPTVTNCPIGHVTTDIITSLTTWCPGNPTYTPVPTTTPVSDEYTTSTVYATNIVTVTKCPQTVTDCPASSTVVVTSVYPVSTTVCPVVPLPTDSGLPSVIPPYGNNNGTVPAGPTGPAGPGGPANPTKSSGPVPVQPSKPVTPVQPSKPVTPVQPSSPVFGSSGDRIGASVSLLMGVVAVALLL
ncbi:hypothetical protein V496_04270 [Pseudogymnoascus sp. VKM F-4515 (FW-2607)]|nr:hypothetical protein V496_04270 [Pseudogymnoascus sp. VKM F-4515 (FW-2607)]